MLRAQAVALLELAAHVDAHGLREGGGRAGHQVEAAGPDPEREIGVVLFPGFGVGAHVLIGVAGLRRIGRAARQRRRLLGRARRVGETEAGALAGLGGENVVHPAVLGGEEACRLADEPVRLRGKRAFPGQPPDGDHDGERPFLGLCRVRACIRTVLFAHVGERLVRQHRMEPVGRRFHRRDAHGGLSAFGRRGATGGHVLPEAVDLSLKAVEAALELVGSESVEALVGGAVRFTRIVQLGEGVARQHGDVEIAKHAAHAGKGPVAPQVAPPALVVVGCRGSFPGSGLRRIGSALLLLAGDRRLLQLLKFLPCGLHVHCREVQHGDVATGGDAHRHAGAALGAPFRRPADNGIDGAIQVRPEQDGDIARVHRLHAVAASVPGRVELLRDREAFPHPLGREGAAVRPGKLVVSLPGQPEGALFDRCAGGECGVSSFRAPGGEMKAGIGHLPGKRCHVGQHRTGSLARADPGPAQDAGLRIDPGFLDLA